MAIKTVVFDLDGTLADTSRDLIAAANRCFEELGFGAALDPVADAATAFRGGRAMLTLGFSRVDRAAGEAEIDREYPRFLGAYREVIDRETKLYPGASRAVTALRHAGFRTSICTNKPEGLAELLMQRLGFREAFDALVGADTLPVRKPDPAPYVAAVERAGGRVEQSVLIGDTVTDRDTARAAGVPVVLVAFGPGGADAAELAPDALIGHFDELSEVVADLLG
ncbi:MAG: HAD-IA family hydrolase [Paracoccaceae bacterium]|nr:HAD-IA family hydrolase [Paracoccaceae bacterium]